MTPLKELQRQLVASVTAGASAPTGCNARAIASTQRALLDKRSRAAAQLLPRLRAALDDEWPTLFAQHAAAYLPYGLLPHVDDALEFAAALSRDPDVAVRRAAADARLVLRLRFTRTPGGARVRPRRGMLIGIRHEPRGLICRLPGSEPRIIAFPF